MRVLPFALFALLFGCGQDAPTKAPPSTGHLSGAGGSGGAGPGSGGAGGAGQGGDAELDAGVDPPTDAGPPEAPCVSDLAYWASGMSFLAPTPEPLGLALSELTYDPTSHPISVVLAAKGGVASAAIGVSATVVSGNNPHIFPAGKKPILVPASISFGSFESAQLQAKGYLHLVDLVGPVDIELEEITVKATTSSNCSNVQVTLSAFIPVSMGSTVLHLKGGNATIAELGDDGGGGPKDAGATPWEIRAFFPGETISFDFSSL